MSKFGMKVHNHWCDSRTSFKVKRSMVKVTSHINADTLCAISSEWQGLRTSTWYTDGGRRPASATDAMTFKVARSRDQSESSWPSAVPVSLETGWGILCRPKPAATLLVSYRLLPATPRSGRVIFWCWERCTVSTRYRSGFRHLSVCNF